MSKKRLQLSIPKENLPPVKSRFDFTMNDEDFEEYTRGFIPHTTIADTNKCVKLFQDWMKERNALFPKDRVPEDILTFQDKSALCKWLCKFSTEVRKKYGTCYPPKTIHHYLMGIQRHIRLQTKTPVNLITDTEFLQLRNLLDALYRKLHSSGVGTSIKKTPVLTDEDEETLWTSGILDPETPQGLLNCVFFKRKKFLSQRGCGTSGLEAVSAH